MFYDFNNVLNGFQKFVYIVGLVMIASFIIKMMIILFFKIRNIIISKTLNDVTKDFNPEMQKEILDKIFGKMTDEEAEEYKKNPNHVAKVNINMKELKEKYDIKKDKGI